MEWLENILQWLNPETILISGGVYLLLLIVFLESGFFFGFFLPGDSLLFTTGLLCGTGVLPQGLGELLLLLNIAAILGYSCGYLFGNRMGKFLLNMPDSLFYKKKYLDMTRSYYERHGKFTLVIGRFLPIIRTFVPILAGLVGVNIRQFLLYNVLGSLVWICSFVVAGFLLGKSFPQIKEYLELVVIGMIVISSIPVISTFRKEKKRNKLTTETVEV
jgi:membrane-associated protein